MAQRFAFLLSLLGCPVLLCASPIVPCPSATMATYTAKNFHCSIGDLSFSKFAFTQWGMFNAPTLTPDLVVVNPLADGFAFSSDLFQAGSFTENNGEFSGEAGFQAITITYSVMGPIDAATLSFCCVFALDVEGLPSPFWSLSESLFCGHQLCGSLQFAGSQGSPVTEGRQSTNFSTVHSIDVSTGVSLEGILNLSPGFANEFSTPTVPEPATLPLLVPGIIGLLRRTQRARRKQFL